MEGKDNSTFLGDGGALQVPPRKKSSFLQIDNSEMNSHTYVYDANKSFQGMTVRGFF
jgi:hypothetical protein